MLVTAKDCLKMRLGVEACESFCPFFVYRESMLNLTKEKNQLPYLI